jgi:hypothetical protein
VLFTLREGRTQTLDVPKQGSKERNELITGKVLGNYSSLLRHKAV